MRHHNEKHSANQHRALLHNMIISTAATNGVMNSSTIQKAAMLYIKPDDNTNGGAGLIKSGKFPPSVQQPRA
jgi:hypothetical protein